MKVLSRFLRELAGLFVDDGLLAILVLAIVAAAAVASLLSGLWGGCVLLAGSLCALCANVISTVRQWPASRQRAEMNTPAGGV